MSEIVPAFHVELRFNHILNFSQEARRIIAPYVKMADSIRVEKQNTLEERTQLNFDESNYQIIADWDRLVFRAQEGMSAYASKNSPLRLPFLDIFDKIKKMEGFGKVVYNFFGIMYVKKLDLSEEDLVGNFVDMALTKDSKEVIDEFNDIGIILDKREGDSISSYSFGPYLGSKDLAREIKPYKMATLGDVEFQGVIMECKHINRLNDITIDEIVELEKKSKGYFSRLCKTM